MIDMAKGKPLRLYRVHGSGKSADRPQWRSNFDRNVAAYAPEDAMRAARQWADAEKWTQVEIHDLKHLGSLHIMASHEVVS